MKHPVVILGGGLAGLALSIDLQRNGVSALVIEKGSYPRHKVCGEYISMESHDYLLGLCPELKNYKLPQIRNFKLSSTGGTEINLPLELGGFGISRYLLEDLLYRQALALGVTILTDTKALSVTFCETDKCFQVVVNDTIIHAAMVCNATGKKSNFETKLKSGFLKSTNYIGIKYHVHLKRESCAIEIHNFNGGYCGISDIENNKSCLCYMVNSALLKKHNNSIPELEQLELFKNRHLASIFNSAEFLSEIPLTISGINFRIKKPVSEGVFYLGDAAGSLAPITTGNGMSMALRSASVLTKYISANKSSEFPFPEIEREYTHFWNREFSARIKFSRHLQKLAEFPSLTKLSILLMKIFPGFGRQLVGATHGKPF